MIFFTLRFITYRVIGDYTTLCVGGVLEESKVHRLDHRCFGQNIGGNLGVVEHVALTGRDISIYYILL